MIVPGEWIHHTDGTLLPIVPIFVDLPDGRQLELDFLLDTGAERTVLTYSDLMKLETECEPSDEVLAGVGGTSRAVRVDQPLKFRKSDGEFVALNGPFLAFADPIALDLSVLGRDILGHFAVIVDKPKRAVMLLHGGHDYRVIAA
jgi:hypothetical protein